MVLSRSEEVVPADGFAFTYEGFDPAGEGLREALTSTGNGFLCARGAAEWEDADGVHYPGTYAHGVYNRETTVLGGRPVLNEDLVNLPDWLVLKLRIEGGDAFRLGEVELLDRHEFDIRNAMVIRKLRFRDRAGRETKLRSQRFVSMADVHHGGEEWTLTPENWSGRVEVVSALDGLNGEAYRGHVFWDELYIYPFLNFRMPEVTRELLLYRYRRLGAARAAAREAGFRGAMFPWQSGSEGTEETQSIHLNPLSGRWEPDLSRNQRHVNAAIFYNIWHYFQATQDLAFMRDYGAEMMLEIARFWASIARFNPERDRYEIHGVMGPDEFHEKYPGAEDGGLRNNAYTNVMVAWLCGVARDVLLLLPATRAAALRDRLGLDDEELRTWESMSRRMFVPFHGDGIISQFEGYAELEELDWDAYRAKYGNIQRLDRILRAEGDDPAVTRWPSRPTR